MSAVFPRVLVPVEIEPAAEGQLAYERAVQIGETWISIDPWTVRALELAAKLATGGEVCVVHATPDFAGYMTWMTPARMTELQDDATRTTTAALQTLAERHCTGVTLHFVIKAGKPLDVILEAAREQASDAIVLASSGRQAVSRAFLGSTADKVIRQSHCPVVVVPAGAE